MYIVPYYNWLRYLFLQYLKVPFLRFEFAAIKIVLQEIRTSKLVFLIEKCYCNWPQYRYTVGKVTGFSQ